MKSDVEIVGKPVGESKMPHIGDQVHGYGPIQGRMVCGFAFISGYELPRLSDLTPVTLLVPTSQANMLVQGVLHDPKPSALTINQKVTWHYRDECPWDR